MVGLASFFSLMAVAAFFHQRHANIKDDPMTVRFDLDAAASDGVGPSMENDTWH